MATASESDLFLDGSVVYHSRGAAADGTLLTMAGATLAVGDTLLLSDARLSLMRGHRYALIGPNGAGKTTLLRALRMALRDAGAAVKYVGQTDGERAASDGSTLLEHVLRGEADVEDLAREAEELESRADELEPEELERLGDVLAQLEESQTPEKMEKAKTLLKGFGFRNPNKAVAALSGGWRSRLEVARGVWAATDVLFLDEPTNHMDLETVLKFSRILCGKDVQGNPRTAVIVSHDAAFLDLVCTDTICIYEGGITQFDGPYFRFEEYVRQNKQFHSDLNAAKEKREKALKASVQAQRQRAAASKNSAAQKNAASREKKLERVGWYREDGKKYKTHSLKVMDASFVRAPIKAMAVQEGKQTNMKLPSWVPAVPAGKTAKEMVTGTSLPLIATSPLVVGPKWGPKQTTLLTTPSLNVSAGDRVAIVGKNGCGKTTLMRVLAGERSPEVLGRGKVEAKVKIAVIGQNQLAQLDGCMDQTPLEWIKSKMTFTPGQRPDEEARKLLACFAIGSDAAQVPIGYLSGGLRVRLLLAHIFIGSPQIIFLDEPTNHLDGESIGAFIDLCRSYPGAIVGISHNVSFLLQVFTDLWIVKDKTVTVKRCGDSAGFAKAFSDYARPLAGPENQEAFDSMMRTRAARSALIAEAGTTLTSLVV